jgi:hypothetical protein
MRSEPQAPEAFPKEVASSVPIRPTHPADPCGSGLPAITDCDPNTALAERPRQALLRWLASAVVEAAAVGDLHTARVAHDALGRLLAGASEVAADVHSIAEARARRGGSGA